MSFLAGAEPVQAESFLQLVWTGGYFVDINPFVLAAGPPGQKFFPAHQGGFDLGLKIFHLAPSARHDGDESALVAIDVQKRLADTELGICDVEEVRTADQASQHLPVVPVQAVISAIAVVGFKQDGNGPVIGHRQLVNQLPEVRTMIFAEAANQLHGPALLLLVSSCELHRGGVLMNLTQVHTVSLDRLQYCAS